MASPSSGAYAPNKILAHPDRLKVLRAGGRPYPVHLHLIISDLCNLSCRGCAYRMDGYSSNQLFSILNADGTKNQNPPRFLETALVESVLRDCVEMGTRAVEFTGGGEPTVHPEAKRLLEYAQDLGLETALITNGILLPRVGDVAVKGQWLRISIDAATEKTYGTVRAGVGGPQGENLRKAIRAVEWARERRDALGTDCVIGVGFVVQKENFRELYEAVGMYREAGADNVRVSALFTPEGDAYFDGWREEALEIEAAVQKDFHNGEFKVYGRLSEKLSDLQAPPDYPRCWYQEMTTYLAGDGNLYRCCVTSYNKQGHIGNVREAGGLKALWDSQEKREAFDGFDARTCPRCQFSDRNRAINAAVTAPAEPTMPAGFVHPDFV